MFALAALSVAFSLSLSWANTCSIAHTHAQAEFAELEATLQIATVPAEHTSEDSRRAVLQKTYATLTSGANADTLTRLQNLVSRGERNEEYQNLLRELQNATNTIAPRTMSATCSILNGLCDPEALSYPNAARINRSMIALREHSAEQRPSLIICDELSAPPSILPKGSIRQRLPADLTQCLTLDLLSGAITAANCVYVFVGVYDGCFGDPSSDLTDFLSYWQHRMRYETSCL